MAYTSYAQVTTHAGGSRQPAGHLLVRFWLIGNGPRITISQRSYDDRLKLLVDYGGRCDNCAVEHPLDDLQTWPSDQHNFKDLGPEARLGQTWGERKFAVLRWPIIRRVSRLWNPGGVDMSPDLN